MKETLLMLLWSLAVIFGLLIILNGAMDFLGEGDVTGIMTAFLSVVIGMPLFFLAGFIIWALFDDEGGPYQ